MALRLIETMFYLVISNIHVLVYFSMIMSMYANCGLISLIYPFSVFGYALLEETRPKQFFWTYVRRYTMLILFLKFFANLKLG